MFPEASPAPRPARDLLYSPADGAGNDRWFDFFARVEDEDFSMFDSLLLRNDTQKRGPLVHDDLRRLSSLVAPARDFKRGVARRAFGDDSGPVQRPPSYILSNPRLPPGGLSLLKMTTASERFTKRMRNVKRNISAPLALGRVASRALPGRPARNESFRQIMSKFRRKTHDCVICQAPIEGIQVRVACGHYYDVQCLLDRVEASTRDESLFPPRCCQQHIPDRAFERYMPSSLADVFAKKSLEFSTTRRVYCANPACSHFLGARTKGPSFQVLECPGPGCATRTCSRCRAPVSPRRTHRCGHDPAQKEVLALASEKGWARCPACDHMIELRSGCYQMTCVCAMQFCYLCRAPWKTCSCPRWEQVQLPGLGQHYACAAPLRSVPAVQPSGSSRRPTISAPDAKRRPLSGEPRITKRTVHRVPVPNLDSLAQIRVPKTEPAQNHVSPRSLEGIDHDIVMRGLLAQRQRRAAQYRSSRPLSRREKQQVRPDSELY